MGGVVGRVGGVRLRLRPVALPNIRSGHPVMVTNPYDTRARRRMVDATGRLTSGNLGLFHTNV